MSGALQAAEKLHVSRVLYQGMTLVVSQVPKINQGFSPCGSLPTEIGSQAEFFRSLFSLDGMRIAPFCSFLGADNRC